MLVGKHQQLLAALPRPLHHCRRVGGRADNPAVGADERFYGCGRVDVGDRNDACTTVLDRVRADTHLRELAPGNFELVGGRHVRHGAAGGEVGQHDFLMRRAENVRALRHEVDATEDDELRGALARGRARQLQRVPGEIGELDDLVALIVMAQDDDPVTERPLCSGDPLVHFVVGKTQVFLGERLALSDALFLDLGQ